MDKRQRKRYKFRIKRDMGQRFALLRRPLPYRKAYPMLVEDEMRVTEGGENTNKCRDENKEKCASKDVEVEERENSCFYTGQQASNLAVH